MTTSSTTTIELNVFKSTRISNTSRLHWVSNQCFPLDCSQHCYYRGPFETEWRTVSLPSGLLLWPNSLYTGIIIHCFPPSWSLWLILCITYHFDSYSHFILQLFSRSIICKFSLFGSCINYALEISIYTYWYEVCRRFKLNYIIFHSWQPVFYIIPWQWLEPT